MKISMNGALLSLGLASAFLGVTTMQAALVSTGRAGIPGELLAISGAVLMIAASAGIVKGVAARIRPEARLSGRLAAGLLHATMVAILLATSSNAAFLYRERALLDDYADTGMTSSPLGRPLDLIGWRDASELDALEKRLGMIRAIINGSGDAGSPGSRTPS